MSKQDMRARLAELLADGFDGSELYGERWGMASIAVRCSQCAIVMVEGTPLHGEGCPHERRETDG